MATGRGVGIVVVVCLAAVLGCSGQAVSGKQPAAAAGPVASPNAATPGAPASEAAPATAPAKAPSPVTSQTTKSTDTPPQAGASIPIQTTLTASALTATLLWRLNYDAEYQVAFSGTGAKLQAEIPAGVTQLGDMVRWAIEAQLPGGSVAREPKFSDENSTQYYGTVVANPEISSNLPVLEWFSPDPGSVVTQRGARCSIYFGGNFYDNIECARKGVTSLSWPKPKLKFDFHKDNLFLFKEGLPRVDRIDGNSNFREPGDNSYMRETVGYALMKAAGSPTVNTQWASLNLNNQFYGFYTLLTKIDNQTYLQQNGLRPSGALYKALDGQLSNLRWDVVGTRLQYNYKAEGAIKSKNPTLLNSTAPGTPYGILNELLLGINGGGPGSRSQWAFDHLNLPAIVNEMAVQTAMLNQDRCTKNYYLYRDDVTGEWQRLPYDLKSAFATDRGFNGLPAKDYCVLACAQWNSPLYCSDTQHAQDLSSTTPWAVITPQFGTFSGSSGGRRLSAAPLTAALPPNATVDQDFTTGASITGANGTLNYLIKLIVDIPETRAMYFRRLRTIMDTFLNGFVQQQFTTNYNTIVSQANKDNAKWNGGDPALGFKQMIQETLPIRKRQLYNTYGPGGGEPLIPATQSGTPAVTLGSAGGTGDQAYLELLNPQNTAVDISSWKMTGAATFTFRPGTVIPPQGSIFVSPNVVAFRARATSPMAGEGRFVQGSAQGNVTGAVSLEDNSGNAVPATAVAAGKTASVADSSAG